MSNLLLMSVGTKLGAVAATTPFSPSDVAGLKLWLKADVGTNQTVGGAAASADGDPVGEWKDQSGNAYDATQSTAAKRPTLKLNIINGNPILRFAGSHWLGDTTLSNIITASDYTVYIVTIITATGSNFAVTYSNEGIFTDAAEYFGSLYLRSDTPRAMAYNWNVGDVHTDQTIALATAYGFQQYHTGGTLYLLRTGAAETNVATGNTAVLTGTVYVGSGNGNLVPFTGDIAEIIVYNTNLAAGDKTSVKNYLATRWGLTW